MKASHVKWIAAAAVVFVAGLAGLYITASILSKRFEPAIRKLAMEYLRKRFDSEVELESLQIHIPKLSPFRLVTRGGRGTLARPDRHPAHVHAQACKF
jgi:hypothetical protein